jgi:hypothetical protein
VWAFLGVAIIAVALGGALPMHNYITEDVLCQFSRSLCKEFERRLGSASTSRTPD